jgi:hypothetical protein
MTAPRCVLVEIEGDYALDDRDPIVTAPTDCVIVSIQWATDYDADELRTYIAALTPFRDHGGAAGFPFAAALDRLHDRLDASEALDDLVRRVADASPERGIG